MKPKFIFLVCSIRNDGFENWAMGHFCALVYSTKSDSMQPLESQSCDCYIATHMTYYNS